MLRHAPELECSTEDKASLVAITKGRIEEARAVERARIILACLEGKEIQQVARELSSYVANLLSGWKRTCLSGFQNARILAAEPQRGLLSQAGILLFPHTEIELRQHHPGLGVLGIELGRLLEFGCRLR